VPLLISFCEPKLKAAHQMQIPLDLLLLLPLLDWGAAVQVMAAEVWVRRRRSPSSAQLLYVLFRCLTGKTIVDTLISAVYAAIVIIMLVICLLAPCLARLQNVYIVMMFCELELAALWPFSQSYWLSKKVCLLLSWRYLL